MNEQENESRVVDMAIKLISAQRDYLLGKLVLAELELRGDEATSNAGRYIWLREQMQMSAPDADDPYGVGLSNGFYRAVGRGQAFKKPFPGLDREP